MVTVFRSLSINELCEKLGGCDFNNFTRIPLYPSRCICCMPDVGTSVRFAIGKAKEAFRGLCLDCVRQHKKNKEEWAKCRVPHTDFRGLE